MAFSSSSPSAPVISPQSWNYDVFLSFRGEDTRKNYVDHIFSALRKQGIYTYKDDETLPRGESIRPTLLKAIEASQIAVIIFSKNYPNSTWCLDELTHIIKCRDEGKQTVLPIFYDVKPTELKNYKLEDMVKTKSWEQTVVNDPWENLKYREAAGKQELENNAKVKSWRNALLKASKISGWETKQIDNGNEAQGINRIVDEISQRLVTSRENEDLPGMWTRVQGLRSEIQAKSGGVRMIGIWGIGGGGKTALASCIFDKISEKYDECCFIKDVAKKSNEEGLEKLQEKILLGILKPNQVQEVWEVNEGRRRLKSRLRHKKVLIVLDNVDRLDQLEALVGSRDWFGDGSLIIITTRDENILNAHGVDLTHPIRLLERDEAVMLFCKYAFPGHKPMEGYKEISEEVVSYAGGLPLALKVLGSFLCDKDIDHWRSALDKLKKTPHKDIIGMLRISFDGLDPVEKDLFLDIACLFRWKHIDEAMKLMHACDFHPIIGIEVLRQKALIVIDEDGRFDMHDMVQEMGHYIVRGEHPKNPKKHSRVWKTEDIQSILAMDATTIAANMNKLRWIDLRAHHPRNKEQTDEITLPLPENFPPTQLCFLHIYGRIHQKQLWDGYKYLPNLRHMELVDMPNLIKIPDFAALPNLETFRLYGCPCLEEIHPSIGRLKRLVSLSIQLCVRLRKFPSITQIKKLETLQFTYCEKVEIISKDMYNIPHNNSNHRRLWFSHSALRKLDLSWCGLGDEEIGSDDWELPNLEELDLEGNTFSRLDFGILRLPRLKWLNVSGCYLLTKLSELPSSIAVVKADICHSLESFGDISNCKWLWNVSLAGHNKLYQDRCDTLIHSMLQGNAIEDHFITMALPYQFKIGVDKFYWGNTCRLHLPYDWYNEFYGFLICIVTNMKYPCIKIIIKQEDPPFDLSQESDEVVEDIYGENMTCVGYVSFSSFKPTTFLTSSCNIISITMEDMYILTNGKSTYVSTKLIPWKSKSDKMQTTDCSRFWDKKIQDADLNTFTIKQCDSGSSVEILWKPCSSNGKHNRNW